MTKAVLVFIGGLVSGPILFALAGVAGLLPSNANSAPPGWEHWVGTRALDASLDKRSRGLKNPYASNKKAIAAGGKLYADACAGCHGLPKRRSSWGTNDFYPRVPQFYEGATVDSPEAAYAAIHDGIRYSGMAAWNDQLSESDMWKLANFIATIRPTQPAASAKTAARQ